MSPNEYGIFTMERQKKRVSDVAEALRLLGMRVEAEQGTRGGFGADAPEITILARRLPGLLQQLDERKRDILCQRFGIAGIEPATLQTLGTKYELTRERIRQIQNTAIDQLAELLDVCPN